MSDISNPDDVFDVAGWERTQAVRLPVPAADNPSDSAAQAADAAQPSQAADEASRSLPSRPRVSATDEAREPEDAAADRPAPTSRKRARATDVDPWKTWKKGEVLELMGLYLDQHRVERLLVTKKAAMLKVHSLVLEH